MLSRKKHITGGSSGVEHLSEEQGGIGAKPICPASSLQSEVDCSSTVQPVPCSGISEIPANHFSNYFTTISFETASCTGSLFFFPLINLSIQYAC